MANDGPDVSDVGVEFIKVGLVAMKFPEDGADFCLHRINFIVVEVNLGAEFINIGAPDARITDGVIKLDRDRAEISGVFAKITPRHDSLGGVRATIPRETNNGWPVARREE